MTDADLKLCDEVLAAHANWELTKTKCGQPGDEMRREEVRRQYVAAGGPSAAMLAQALRAILTADVGKEVAEIEDKFLYVRHRYQNGNPTSDDANWGMNTITKLLTHLRAALARVKELELKSDAAKAEAAVLLGHVDALCSAITDRVRDPITESFFDVIGPASDAIADAAPLAAAFLAEYNEAKAKQRTEGTVEVCLMCRAEVVNGSARMVKRHLSGRVGICTGGDCPLRSKAST